MEIGIDSFAAILPDPISGNRTIGDRVHKPGGAFLVGDPATVAAKHRIAGPPAMKRSIELLGRDVAPIARNIA